MVQGLASETDWPKWTPMSVLNVVCTNEEIETTAMMVETSVVPTAGKSLTSIDTVN